MLSVIGILTLCAVPQAQAGGLALGRATTVAGRTVTVPLVYTAGRGPDAVALATDIRFDPAVLSQPRCAGGRSLGSGKDVKCSEPRSGLLRLAVYGLNLDSVPAGEVATVTFDVAPGARPRSYQLRHTASAATADGTDFTLRQRPGTVRVSALPRRR